MNKIWQYFSKKLVRLYLFWIVSPTIERLLSSTIDRITKTESFCLKVDGKADPTYSWVGEFGAVSLMRADRCMWVVLRSTGNDKSPLTKGVAIQSTAKTLLLEKFDSGEIVELNMQSNLSGELARVMRSYLSISLIQTK